MNLSISGSLFSSLSNAFVFPDPEPPVINILNGWSGISGQFGLCSIIFFFNTIKVKHCFIILLHLISSFLHTRSLLASCTYVSIESIDWIILSSFELKASLLISSVRTLYLSVLNLCYVINITLLFFTNSLRLSISVLFFSKWFILFLVWAASKQFLKCWNLSFLFMTHFFVFFFVFYLHHCCLLDSYMLLLLIQKIIWWSFHLIHLSLVELPFQFLL